MSSITWDRSAAAHLLRRAGLPGAPGEVDALEARGLEGAVDWLLDFEATGNTALEDRLAALELDLTTPQGIVRDWIVRFVHTARPFEERMALFWHMHFATGLSKVKYPSLMYNQIETFRRKGLGTLDELLLAVSRDPAMLIWLDNIHNHRDAPNENYARELMELFSMGLNTYTQEDVVESARAFTGWGLRRVAGGAAFVFRQQDHDGGTKTFLGRTGTWNGDDIVRIICEQEVTPAFIAARMWSHFAGGELPQPVLEAVTEAYWSSGHSLRAMFRALFTAPAFYAEAQRWTHVKNPVELTCGLLRQLEAVTDGRRVAGAVSGQGLALYNADDPSGWHEGLAWITTTSLLLRSQLGSVVGLADNEVLRVDLPGLLRREGVTTAEGAVDSLIGRLDLPAASDGRRAALAAYLVTDPRSGGTLPFDLDSQATAFKLAGLVHILVTDPGYQLS